MINVLTLNKLMHIPDAFLFFFLTFESLSHIEMNCLKILIISSREFINAN